MKKIMKWRRNRYVFLSVKSLLIMKFTIAMLMLVGFGAVASNTYSQDARVSLAIENARIKEVLIEIEEASEFFFIYNDKLIDVEKRVNINVVDEKIKSVLDDLFKSDDVDYVVMDRQIILSPGSMNVLANQQNKKSISGNVTDATGEPVPGVSVAVKGTTMGTITDMDGNYLLSGVSSGDELVFSFIGLKTQNIIVENQMTINVILEDDFVGINEVIAVGYQSKSKKNLTGSIATIDTKQLENRAAPRLTDMLKGAATGLNVSYDDPGRIGTSKINIRVGGLTRPGKTDPLVVIDGIAQLSIDALNDVNPDDIAKFSVLKDAEAAVYGSRAAGGVLVIETKTGQGKPKFKVGINHKITTPRTYRKTTNVLQTMEMYKEAHEYQEVSFFGFPGVYNYIEENDLTFDKIKNNDYKYVYGPGSSPFPDTRFMPFGHTDWMEKMYGTAHATSYDFSASGATGKINYFFSSSLKNEESMMKYGENSSKSYYSRLKLDYRHSEKLKFGINMSMKYQNHKEPTLYESARDGIAAKFSWNAPYTPEGNPYTWSGANLISMVTEGGDRQRNHYNFTTQFYADYKLLKNLTATAKIHRYANFSKVRSVDKNFELFDWDESSRGMRLGGGYNSTGVVNEVNSGYTGNFLLKYNVQLNNIHTIRALAGASHEEFRWDKVEASRKNLISDALTSLNMGDSEEQYNSDVIEEEVIKGYFANVSYSFKDKYYIEGNYRNDGSSRFAEGYKWKDFYSVSGAYNITEENFIKDLGWKNLNFLKFRVSYAELGSQAGIDRYDFVQQIKIDTHKKDYGHVILGDAGSPSLAQFSWMDGFPAYTRTWEIAKKMNYGLDMNLFENRLSVAANVFVSNNDNVFYNEEFPAVIGTSAPPINGASFKTKGWDLSMNWSDSFNKDFSYNIGFGINDANSIVTSLADSRIVKFGWNEFVEGYAPGTIFGFVHDGIIQNEEELAEYQELVSRAPGSATSKLYPGDSRYKDLDGDGVIEGTLYEEDENGNPTDASGDIVELGSVEQHYQYFIKGGVSWKNFDFSFVLDGVGKWITFDETMKNYDKPWNQPSTHAYRTTWAPERTDAHYPRFAQVAGDWSYHRNANNYTLSDAPYMRRDVPYLAIQNIQLGYNLPSSLLEKLNIAGVYIYANGANLGYLINHMPEGFIPEQPWKANLTPYPATYSFGANINF